ncbi:hypothetical protein AB0H71_30810 [Nocardia sp. NPDC050697]|uniref:hypothetical protein n=1 Tax=Nocardia sp. NPDC050697 TaxID=3155158 RepID=UPI0033F51B80
MAEVTAAADWNAGWDRMIAVYGGSDPERINRAAGLPGYCWPGLPGFDRTERRLPVFYVFIAGNTAVQSVRSHRYDQLFDLDSDTRILRPESMLEPVPPKPSIPGSLRVVP